MKKRILLSFLLVLSIVLLTACSFGSKGEKITYSDAKLKLTTTFEYDKEDGFKKEKDVDGGKYAEIEFSNEKQNLYFDMYYSKNSTKTTEELKDSRKKDKYYKEYKYGDYEAYTYGSFEDQLNLVINVKEDKDAKETVELFVAIDFIKYNKEKVVADIFKNDVIQDFFKSIKITED